MSEAGGAGTDTAARVTASVTGTWDREVVPALFDYIRIPNLSPAFDPGWEAAGHMDRAVDLIVGWCRTRAITGLTVDVHRLPGRTPVVVVDVPASGRPVHPGDADDLVLLYGHLDKQPEMEGWRDGLGPWDPVLDGDRLYGRGGADDGYAVFAALTALEAGEAAGLPHARCLLLVEASEESGSPDLPAHVEALSARIGTPSLVVCLDSGCLDYERIWLTTSLRGLIGGRLDVTVMDEGVHSGSASGVVPSTFRIARELLARIEDGSTGAVTLPECHVDVPADRRAQAAAVGSSLLEPIANEFPFVPGAGPVTDDPTDQLLQRTWSPMLEVIGADGLPPTARAGNVLRPSTSLALSLRIPPTCDPARAEHALALALTTDPPYGARVEWHPAQSSAGWNAPEFAPWLLDGLARASQAAFGETYGAFGQGGSIPFMAMLGTRFPDAQFAVMGVLGPASNAHGPNEFLHVDFARRLTVALALLLDSHATRG